MHPRVDSGGWLKRSAIILIAASAMIANASIVVQASPLAEVSVSPRSQVTSKQTQDGSTVDLELTTMSVKSAVTARVASYKCRTNTYDLKYRTSLGLMAFTWTAKARWCYNGTKVKSVSHSTYLSANNGFNVLRAPSIDRQFYGNSGHTYAIVEVAGHVENCIPRIGCIADYYPYVYLTLKKNGNWIVEYHK